MKKKLRHRHATAWTRAANRLFVWLNRQTTIKDMQVRDLGATIIDDSLNANPLSVSAGLQSLRQIAGTRKTVAVLGNLEEQGGAWRQVHREIGAQVAKAGVDRLVTVGAKAAEIATGALDAGMPAGSVHVCRSLAGAYQYLRSHLTPDTVVFIKGSHSTGLSRLAAGLRRGNL